MKKGFTMIELVLVVGILAILASLAMPMSLRFYRSQVVEGARDDLISLINRAKHNARLMKYDDRHGLYIDTTGGVLENYVIYRGDNYGDRLSDFDEVYAQASNLTISFTGSTGLVNNQDLNFAKLTGGTTATGTITIRFADNAEARSVFVDSYGNAYATSTP